MSALDRVRWLILNRLNNARADADIDSALEMERFPITGALPFWSSIDATASPARRLSDFFWLSLPWQRIASELGGVVRVLEVGCGSGRYGTVLERCLGPAYASYLGVDMTPHPQWSQQETNPEAEVRLRADSGTAAAASRRHEFRLTVSSADSRILRRDFAFFNDIAEHLKVRQAPLIQVHLMPSAACLTTFLWHGVRQYTPRTVSRITKLFGAETVKRLYFLGSAACNRVHRRYITYPWLLGRSDPGGDRRAEYERDLRRALHEDEVAPRANEACFHALVLLSRVSHDFLANSRSAHAERVIPC